MSGSQPGRGSWAQAGRGSRPPPTALYISLGAHAVLFTVLLFVKGPSLADSVERRVVVEFDAAPPLLSAPLTQSPALPRIAPAPLQGSLQLQGPQRLSLPAGLAGVAGPAAPPSAARAVRQEAPPPPRPQAPAAPAAVSVPSAREVLALEAPPAAAAPPGAAPAAAGRTTDSAERGILLAPALEWEGRARTLLRSGSLAFPEVLLREGQDADVEVRFVVAPSGTVLRVEIVRGSGYAAVDREVEKTVLAYLFEPAPEGSEDSGSVQFRFRLERER